MGVDTFFYEPISDGHPAQTFSSGRSCQTNDCGPEGTGTQSMRLPPGEISMWTSKACDKN